LWSVRIIAQRQSATHTKALLIALNARIQLILRKRECFPVDRKRRKDEYEKNECAK
jgi:hypothetical protein